MQILHYKDFSGSLKASTIAFLIWGRPWFRRGLRSKCGHTEFSVTRKTLYENSRKRRNLRFGSLMPAVAAVGQWAV